MITIYTYIVYICIYFRLKRLFSNQWRIYCVLNSTFQRWLDTMTEAERKESKKKRSNAKGKFHKIYNQMRIVTV